MAEQDDRFTVIDVEVDRTSHVALTFADGHEARFELAALRSACPCATCRSVRDRGGQVRVPEAVAVASAELVGNWGLGLDWSDGHSTGIYSWDLLRAWSDRDLGPPSFVPG